MFIRLMLKFIINSVAIIRLFPSFCRLKPERQIAKLLLENGLVISCCESCTGGLIASRLTDVSGSSGYIDESLVTYANEAKEKYLNVSSVSIIEHGVVSKQIVRQMARGLLKATGCDIAISTSGIAGPLGGTEKKPIGLIYICIATKKETKVLKFNANKHLSRRIMKYTFSQVALQALYKFLKRKYR